MEDLCAEELPKDTHECPCLGEFKMVDLLCSPSMVCPPDLKCHDSVVAGCHKTNKKSDSKMCSPGVCPVEMSVDFEMGETTAESGEAAMKLTTEKSVFHPKCDDPKTPMPYFLEEGAA